MQKSFLNKTILFLFIFPCFFSCKSTRQAELVLAPVFPPEIIETVVKETPLPIVPLYVQGRVMEVEVLQGVQKFLYIKFNSEIIVGDIPETDIDISEEKLINMPKNFTLVSGMKGEIFSDTKFAEKAGDFVLLEQYGEIYKARIDVLNYIIDRSSLVQIQIR
jgi:hypothetical protein